MSEYMLSSNALCLLSDVVSKIPSDDDCGRVKLVRVL